MKDVLLATFKIKISGFTFPDNEEGFSRCYLYRDDEFNLWIHIPTLISGKLIGQLNSYNQTGNFAEFGSLIECRDAIFKASYNNPQADIDFSNSGLVTFKYGSETGMSFYIDNVEIGYTTSNDKPHASFLLNKQGFEIIKEYYSLWFTFKDDVYISKQEKEHCFSIFNTEFHPLFYFTSEDSVRSEEVKIKKHPYIISDIFEESSDVKLHFDYLMQLMRIFYNVEIDYLIGEVNYKNKTEFFFKTPVESSMRISSLDWFLKGSRDIDFFTSNTNVAVLTEYFHQLEAIISQRIRSRLLSGATKFLVLYSMLESLIAINHKQSGKPQTKDIFSNYKKIKERYDSLLKDILECVQEEERDDFSEKWRKSCPRNKSAKSVMETYFEQIGINSSEVSKLLKEYTNDSYSELRVLRNDIAHGNRIVFDRVNFDSLNRLIFIINTIALCDIIGFKSLSLKNTTYSAIYSPNE